MQSLKKLGAGKLTVYASLVITVVLWLLSKSSVSEIIDWPWISITQISALLGTVLFTWSMVLSTRLSVVEDMFSGLDKVYHFHRKVSEWGFVLILVHPLSLIIDDISRLYYWLLPWNPNWSYNWGIISFWIFVYLVVATLFIRELKLPYHIWKWTHKAINLAMIFALLHLLMVKSDVSIYAPLGLWMNILTIGGVVAGLYKMLFYDWLAPHVEYKISFITKRDDLYDISFKPAGQKKLDFQPGQYAYVSFNSKKVNSESHPYCIASQPDEDSLRLVIKELGDHTKTLGGLKKGETAILYGPHGRISKKYYAEPKKDAVFVGGGIGIAPFLAMFRSPQDPKSKRQTALFYCTRYKEEAIFDAELVETAMESNKLYYHNQCSREGDGHLDMSKVMKSLKKPENTIFYLCATGKMMSEIRKDLLALGVDDKNIVLEDFDMI